MDRETLTIAYNALAVIAKTKIIRDFLEINDRMALRQVEDAMLALEKVPL